MAGNSSDEGLKLSGKEGKTDKKKKKSQEEDVPEKDPGHKKKSSLSSVDDLDKASAHKKKTKEAKSSDMDKSGHHKKKKKEKDKEKDEATPMELDKSTHKKKKTKEGESLDKVSTHKQKSKTKDDLDKGSKHVKRHSKTESTEKSKSDSLDKASTHQKKVKESAFLDTSSRHKKKSKDMDKSSHKKQKSKSISSLDESSTHDTPDALSSSARKRTSSVSSTEKDEKGEKDPIVADSADKRGKKVEKDGKDALAANSTHKRGKKSEKDGKDALAADSTHKRGKKSDKDGKDALATDSKHKRGKKSEKDGKDALAAASTHRRGKKAEVLKPIDEEASEMDPPGEHVDQHRRGKKKDILRASGVDKANESKDVVGGSASKKTEDDFDPWGTQNDAADENSDMDTTTGAQKVRFPTIDDASETSDDDSSVASFGEEGDEDRPPPPRIAGSSAQVNRQGTRGPPGVYLARDNSKNLGRILATDASEDDIFAALEAEADRLKEENGSSKSVTRGLTRSKSISNSHRSSSFDKKQKAESNLPPKPPKWQPGQQIKPMAAEDLRAMLNMKSPPKQTQTWRDSRWFRDDVVPDMPIALAVNALPTIGNPTDSGKLVTLPNGSVKMLRPDQCEDMKMYSAMRKSMVKDALRQSLNATIH